MSAGLIGLAATITGTFVYPGLAIVLLIVVNDVFLAEIAVSYLMMKPEVKAHFGKAALIQPHAVLTAGYRFFFRKVKQ